MSPESPPRGAGRWPADWGLDASQDAQLDALLRLLESDQHAPTTIRDADSAAAHHVADSLAALEVGALGRARTVTDLGSGAGFPGLAIAVALPRTEVSLVESQRRKCDFLARACAA